MIGYLKGALKSNLEGDTYILLVNSIGFNVNLIENFVIGDEVELKVYTHFTESNITLWGFREERIYRLFQLLISISGIGPKIASNFIKAKGFESIVDSIVNNDANSLKGSGVGAKTAAKIILELQDKISSLSAQTLKGEDYEKRRTILEALVSLGYDQIVVLEYLKKLDLSLEKAEIIIKKFLVQNK